MRTVTAYLGTGTSSNGHYGKNPALEAAAEDRYSDTPWSLAAMLRRLGKKGNIGVAVSQDFEEIALMESFHIACSGIDHTHFDYPKVPCSR